MIYFPTRLSRNGIGAILLAGMVFIAMTLYFSWYELHFWILPLIGVLVSAFLLVAEWYSGEHDETIAMHARLKRIWILHLGIHLSPFRRNYLQIECTSLENCKIETSRYAHTALWFAHAFSPEGKKETLTHNIHYVRY